MVTAFAELSGPAAGWLAVLFPALFSWPLLPILLKEETFFLTRP